MASEQVLRIIAHGKHYKEKPSRVLGIVEQYDAFCFDEACAYIFNEMTKQDGKKPCFKGQKNGLLEFLLKRKED